MTGSFQKIKRFWPELVVCLLLAFAVHAIYIQAITFGFVGVEDEILYSEPRSRLDAGGTPLLECFRMTSNTLYWVPVSNLVLFTDVWLCGDNIGMLHLMNVSTHAANTVLLFLVLRIATACIRRSAFVAALLGLHPMNTESVVCWSWGATQVEAFMTMVTFLFYFNYARKPTVKKFVPVILCFILCLLSRPSILYLPVLLLLFDYWPLGRWRQKNTGKRDNRFAMSSPGKLIAEKIPLLMISALYLAVIFFVLRLTPAVPSVRTLLPESSLYLLNLPIAYVLFLWTFFFPFYLPYFFPDPMTPPFMMPLWQVILASIGLIFTSLAVVKKGNKYPF